MKSAEEIVKEQRAIKDGKERESSLKILLMGLVSQAIKKITDHKYKVEIADFNPVIKLDAKDLKINIPEQKAPVVNVPESVKVRNLSEIKFPKQKEVIFPSSFEVSNLGELKKSLEGLHKCLEKETPQQEVSVEIDTKDIVKAVKEVKKAVNDIIFPIPNFISSWQHSLTMQSEDLAKTIVYTTVAATKVVSYIEFAANDGYTYRKTYSYDVDGDCTGWTEWTRQ